MHAYFKYIIAVAVILTTVFFPKEAGATSLRFFGAGSGDIDRVKIPVDSPHRTVDVGSSFTIEFWMKASDGENNPSSSAPTCVQGSGVAWINGNVIIDRDIYGDGDHGDWGVSLYEDGIAFGLSVGSASYTICGEKNVADNQWHHIAVQRNASTGILSIYVDGQLDDQAVGPVGNASYRDGRSTSFPQSDPFLVLGAEKHDVGPDYPSYNGFLDELRISDIVRYTGNFIVPTSEFSDDANSVAIYSFSGIANSGCLEGSVVLDRTSKGNHGVCKRNTAISNGPIYSADVPFVQGVSLTPIVTPSNTFADVGVDFVFYSFIYNLSRDGIINGFPDGTFRPNQFVTRAEMAKFIKNAFDFTFTAGCGEFTDISPQHPFYAPIMTLKCLGVVGGYPDGSFRPDIPVTRGQAMKFVMEGLRRRKADPDFQRYSGSTMRFNDVSTTDIFYEYIMAASEPGVAIVSGYANGTFGITDYTTRGAMSKMVDNARSL